MSRRKEVRETTIRKTDEVIHIETDGCIVNIRPGLYPERNDVLGSSKVTVVEVLPDEKEGEFRWVIHGADDKKLHYASVRVARVKE